MLRIVVADLATDAVGSEMLRISGGRYGGQRMLRIVVADLATNAVGSEMLRIVVANSATNAVATNAVWYAQ